MARKKTTAEAAPEKTPKKAPEKKKIEYIIQPGDTLTSISKKLRVDPEKIIKNNDIISSASLYAGRKIVI